MISDFFLVLMRNFSTLLTNDEMTTIAMNLAGQEITVASVTAMLFSTGLSLQQASRADAVSVMTTVSPYIDEFVQNLTTWKRTVSLVCLLLFPQ